MSKIDLRELLQRTLAANSNQPVANATPPRPQKPTKPNAPPVRAHRALRPRRRS